jgi:hypothetical protein
MPRWYCIVRRCRPTTDGGLGEIIFIARLIDSRSLAPTMLDRRFGCARKNLHPRVRAPRLENEIYTLTKFFDDIDDNDAPFPDYYYERLASPFPRTIVISVNERGVSLAGRKGRETAKLL